MSGPDQAFQAKEVGLPLSIPDEIEAEEPGGAEVGNGVIPVKAAQIS